MLPAVVLYKTDGSIFVHISLQETDTIYFVKEKYFYAESAG